MGEIGNEVIVVGLGAWGGGREVVGFGVDFGWWRYLLMDGIWSGEVGIICAFEFVFEGSEFG